MVSNVSVQDYASSFVQGWPRYTVKPLGGKNWRTIRSVSEPLDKKKVNAHLSGKIALGNLGKWYPGHALLDFDNRSLGFVEEVRGRLNLSDSNSLICTSESDDSYHLIFRPVYAHKPPTLRLLDSILRPFAQHHGIEAYPTATKPCRLPFGPIQQILNPDLWLCKSWREKLFWFNKLDEYDLARVPYHQAELTLDVPAPFEKQGTIPVATEGELLYSLGLQEPRSRHDSQFKVLYFLWRKNVAYSTAVTECYRWIRTKHNGMSKDIGNLKQVRREIESQASWLYSHYALPDEAHNTFRGYLTKADVPDILHLTDGSLPKAKFLFHLVRYCYPRRLRTRITVHSNLFIEWSGKKTYQKRLKELNELGVVERGGYYIIGQKAKDLVLHWNYRHPDDALLVDGRSPDTLEDTIAACFGLEEAKALLKAAGMERIHAGRFLERLYSPTRAVPPP